MPFIKFAVLGSLQVSRQGEALNLGGGKQRVLLSMLACNANEPIATGRLIEAIWGADPPRTAEQNLRVYVYHLRRILGDDKRIVWRPPGYALTVASGELDVDAFESLLAQGRQALAHGEYDVASGLLRGALALWRGPALLGLQDVEPLRAKAVRLEERKLSALETMVTAELALGLHADLVGELSALCAEYPMREHVHAQLMTALYRSGRQGEALAVYRRVRATLIDELGVEPGIELDRLHRAVLAGDAAACDALFPRETQVETHGASRGELQRIREALTEIGRLLDRIESGARTGEPSA